jgi:hypothetical protein
MMPGRIVVAVSLLALAVAAALPSAAAGSRNGRGLRLPDHHYAGPAFVRRIPGIRLLLGDYALSEEEFEALYGEGEEFDESYYEPEALPAAPSAPMAKPQQAAAPRAAKAAGQGQAAASALACGKAAAIVGSYGFVDVKPAACTGRVYAFNATRDGKSFAIKLDAGSGELTEVKKLH